jgi:hypothetical protein
MELYSVTVNLNGQVANQVTKHNVTAAEIRLLQHIHGQSENGAEPVANIVQTATTTRSDRQERARLLAEYRNWQLDQGSPLIEKLFGVAGVPLPKVYEPPVLEAIEDDPGEEDIGEIVTPIDAPPAKPSLESIVG